MIVQYHAVTLQVQVQMHFFHSFSNHQQNSACLQPSLKMFILYTFWIF